MEILANNNKIYTIWSVYALQLIKNYKVYIVRDLHPLGCKRGLDMDDLVLTTVGAGLFLMLRWQPLVHLFSCIMGGAYTAYYLQLFLQSLQQLKMPLTDYIPGGMQLSAPYLPSGIQLAWHPAVFFATLAMQ